MITEVKIHNFKSVADLTLPLGRFNVMIGANGSGKSNILEAIAFGAAASADKLDSEFLGSRGIRIASAKMMKSAFSNSSALLPILLNFKNHQNEDISFTIEENVSPLLAWNIKEKEKVDAVFEQMVRLILSKNEPNELLSGLEKEEQESLLKITANLQQLTFKIKNQEDVFMNVLRDILLQRMYRDVIHNDFLTSFVVYSPEISSLRKFEEESQIKPLGVKGEGLFNVLQIFYENESYGKETIDELRKHLHIIEWFDDFEAVFDKVSGRSSLVVKDRNLPDVTLNQHNVNEGFLFLLFYISLLISKETPAFFAIDNIEASFHPKLCEELIKNMVALAKKHDKQIILTTHNPFVLDGLDLNDPEQKLFVVRRNADGETIADNINKPVKNVKLSEAWMRGRIGGNPETI